MTTAFVYDSRYAGYDFGRGHPFSPARQQLLLQLLEAVDIHLPLIAPRPAPDEAIRQVHCREYVDYVRKASRKPERDLLPRFGFGTPDVPLFRGMHDAAALLAGGTLHAAELVADGEASIALSLGGGLHHAQRSSAAGFCVYNDLSIAIAYLRSRGLRVAYLDVDVHHGDGVQAMFYDDPNVMTISLHESGHYLYPGTGFAHEIGDGDGRGYSINVPLEPDTDDDLYMDAFESVVPHVLSWFQPDVLVVQCGVDAHTADPLADLRLTSRGFHALFARILNLINTHAVGRGVLSLGGGYNLDATVRSWAVLIAILLAEELPAEIPRISSQVSTNLYDPIEQLPPERRRLVAAHNGGAVKRVLEFAAPHWM